MKRNQQNYNLLCSIERIWTEGGGEEKPYLEAFANGGNFDPCTPLELEEIPFENVEY